MQTEETPAAEAAPAEEAAAAAAMETQAEVSAIRLHSKQWGSFRVCANITCTASSGRSRRSGSAEPPL